MVLSFSLCDWQLSLNTIGPKWGRSVTCCTRTVSLFWERQREGSGHLCCSRGWKVGSWQGSSQYRCRRTGRLHHCCLNTIKVVIRWQWHKKQECIPVGCVPPLVDRIPACTEQGGDSIRCIWYFVKHKCEHQRDYYHRDHCVERSSIHFKLLFNLVAVAAVVAVGGIPVVDAAYRLRTEVVSFLVMKFPSAWLVTWGSLTHSHPNRRNPLKPK